LLILALAGILSFFIIQPFLITITLAGIFAVTLFPVQTFILKKVTAVPAIASTLTLIVATISILAPLLFVLTQVLQEAADLYTVGTQANTSKHLIITTVEGLGATIDRILPGTQTVSTKFLENFDIYLQQLTGWVIDNLGFLLSGLSLWLLDLFVFFVALYYFLYDGKKIAKKIIALSPLDQQDSKIILKKLRIAINSVVKGNVFIACIQGILVTIGLLITLVPSAFLWGVAATLTALIPGLGTGVVLLPAILYLFITEQTLRAVILMAWGGIIVGLIDNLLRPKLVGDAMSLHPLLILLAMLGGLFFFGPVGLFVGPIVISLLVTFIDIYSDLVKKINKSPSDFT
jgi:predicted PurR-regulated permease PerM